MEWRFYSWLFIANSSLLTGFGSSARGNEIEGANGFLGEPQKPYNRNNLNVIYFTQHPSVIWIYDSSSEEEVISSFSLVTKQLYQIQDDDDETDDGIIDKTL